MAQRGRVPLRSNESILEAALTSFANAGYEATSVRALNAELGLSHETITQRFGTKPELYRTAVGFGLQRFVDDFDSSLAASAATTDLDRLRANVRAFMVATSLNPNIGKLLHQGAISETDRVQLAKSIGLEARILGIASLLRKLHKASLIRKTSMRELWFLMEAGSAPLHFRDLAAMFDQIDGPLDADRHLDRMVDMVMRSMGATTE